MQVPLVSHPNYSYAFPGRHRFPMEKFGLLLSYLQSKNLASAKNIFRPGKIKSSVLNLAHCPNYVQRFVANNMSSSEIKNLGLPWSEELLLRTLISPNGTLLTAKLALKYGVSCHLAGGTHHAHRDFASGFCIFNDLAITAKALLWQKQVKSVLIFDCDVHQGDGTAAMLADEKRAFTVSIHCLSNFPICKQVSDIDVALPSRIGDQTYLAAVMETFCHAVTVCQPDLVLYDAGVDVYQHDPLGHFNISLDGIRSRDRFVLTHCKEQNIPVATVIGGGYDNDRHALARRHGMVTEEAHRVWQNSL